MVFSLSKDSRGYRLYVTQPDGCRKSLRLTSFGVVSRRQADILHRNLCELVAWKHAGVALDESLTSCIGSVDPRLRSFLEESGLLPPASPSGTVHAYMAAFRDRKAMSVKASTMRVFGRTIKHASGFFSPGESMSDVTPERVLAFRRWLMLPNERHGRILSEATIRKTCAIVSEVFTAAVRDGLIRENPFIVARIKKCVQPNRSREHFVSREDTDRLLECCRCLEERMMVGLARFAGLRMPSEVMQLRWSDHDEIGRTILIRSPKTAHHAHGGIRRVPVFPDLHAILREGRNAISMESEFVLPTLRLYQSLSTRMRRIIRSAGITDYPRAMHNLRLSCISEWVVAQRRDLVTVSEWAGHSIQMMTAHYLKQINADSASRAALQAAQSGVDGASVGAG